MKKYKNINGDSPIVQYLAGEDYVAVRYKGRGGTYVFASPKIRKAHIDRMRVLAAGGKGLSTYINQHPEVKNNFVMHD